MTEAEKWLELTEKLEHIRDELQLIQWKLMAKAAKKRAEQVCVVDPHKRVAYGAVPCSHLEK